MRRTLRLTVVVAAAVGLIWLGLTAAREYQQPVTGDWQVRGASEESSVRMQLKRVTLRPWSEPLPNASLDKHIRSTGRTPGLQKLYLYVEIALHVDGQPLHDFAKDRVRSVGPIAVRYNGNGLSSSGGMGRYGSAESDKYLWYEVTPWMRGFWGGTLEVTHHVTLDTGETVAFEFPIAVE